MEIKLTKTVEEKVNIKLPYYSKWNHVAFKIISNESVIKVNTGNVMFGIEFQSFIMDNIIDSESVEITESEFNELYFQTQSRLNQLL